MPVWVSGAWNGNGNKINGLRATQGEVTAAGTGRAHDWVRRLAATIKGNEMSTNITLKEGQYVRPVIADDGSAVTFYFGAGGGEPVVLNMRSLHTNIMRRAAAVGMAQVRIVDAAAIGRADADGRIRSREEMVRLKRNAIVELVAHYNSGAAEWTKPRAAGGGVGREAGLTIAGIARAFGCDAGRAEEIIAGTMSKRGLDRKAALALWRGTEKVATALAAIRAERATVAGDADALLAELDP